MVRIELLNTLQWKCYFKLSFKEGGLTNTVNSAMVHFHVSVGFEYPVQKNGKDDAENEDDGLR